MGTIHKPGSGVSARDIEAGADAIGAAGVVAFPTETYYALGAHPRKADALNELLRLKGRGAHDKPLLLLLSDRGMVDEWAHHPPAAWMDLADRFWPGPLTLVLPAAPDVPEQVTGGRDTVALRLTSHPVARSLIERCGTALTGTSANRAGEPPVSRVEGVRAAFGDELRHVLDGGDTPGGLPSTLLDLTSEGPTILRAGAVSENEIAAALRLL